MRHSIWHHPLLACMKDLNRIFLVYSTSNYSHCGYIATDTVALYRALAVFTVNLSSLGVEILWKITWKINVLLRHQPARVHSGTMQTISRHPDRQTVFRSLQNKQSTELLPQWPHSLWFLTYPVDNEHLTQSILLVQPGCWATLSTPFRNIQSVA